MVINEFAFIQELYESFRQTMLFFLICFYFEGFQQKFKTNYKIFYQDCNLLLNYFYFLVMWTNY